MTRCGSSLGWSSRRSGRCPRISPESMTGHSGDREPAWSVVRRDRRGLRRLTDRRVAQSEVTAPDGHRYRVAICRNLPWPDSSLAAADDLTLTAISAAALLARAVSVRGRTGWTITVTAAETQWRADRVVDRALDLAGSVQRGERPWTRLG